MRCDFRKKTGAIKRMDQCYARPEMKTHNDYVNRALLFVYAIYSMLEIRTQSITYSHALIQQQKRGE